MRGRRGEVPVPTEAIKIRDLRRTFITPEGVDLRLELGAAGSRAAAFIIDVILMMVILVAITVLTLYVFWATINTKEGGAPAQLLAILWLIGAFILLAGICIYFFHDKMQWLGRLPGDIRVERENFRFYFPITTMILLSLLLSVIIQVIRRFL